MVGHKRNKTSILYIKDNSHNSLIEKQTENLEPLLYKSKVYNFINSVRTSNLKIVDQGYMDQWMKDISSCNKTA